MKREESKQDSAIGLAGGLIGTVASAADQRATDAAVEGMHALQAVAERLGRKSINFLKGDLFELIEVAKFNAESARLGLPIKAVATRTIGAPHAAVDILIKENGVEVERVQAKVSRGTEDLVQAHGDPKYRGMQKLVPVEKAEEVRAPAESRERYWERRGDIDRAALHADTAKNVTGELHHGEVRSGGTTHDEALLAAKNPSQYRVRVEAQYVAREAASAAKAGAVTGVVVGGAIAVAKHGLRLARGEESRAMAAREAAKDSAVAGVRGAATGAGGAVVRYAGRRIGFAPMAKANVATAIAAAVIDTGVHLWKYASGEISGEAAAERIGQTVCSTMASIYAGAAAGTVAGPVGMVVGSIAGYLVATQIYQSGMAILRHARLAKEEAARIESACKQAIEALAHLQSELELHFRQAVGGWDDAIRASFALIDRGLDDDCAETAASGLAQLSLTMGHSLKLVSFERFDEFMKGDEPLRF